MTVSMVREEVAAKPAEFVLPNGVEEREGDLVDNRPFYQARVFGHSSIDTIKQEWQADKEAKAEAAAKIAEDGSYSWNPITMVGNVFSAVFGFFGDMVRGIFSALGYGGEEKAAEARNEETPNEAQQA